MYVYVHACIYALFNKDEEMKEGRINLWVDIEVFIVCIMTVNLYIPTNVMCVCEYNR